MPEIAWLPSLLAAVSSFMLGGFWYSNAAFLKPWLRVQGLEKPQESHPAMVFGISFLCCFLSAATLSAWLGPNPELGFALGRGAAAGGCLVAASLLVNHQFSGKPLRLTMIDGGYHFFQFLIYGLILGAL